jgi:hypothetical protein
MRKHTLNKLVWLLPISLSFDNDAELLELERGMRIVKVMHHSVRLQLA